MTTYKIPEDPKKLGLPFDKWRSFQPGVIEDISNSLEPYKALIAPTGSGKSALAAGYTRITDSRSVVLTATKQLQQQYVDSFEYIAKTVVGMQNFYCLIDNTSVPHAPCRYGFRCDMQDECDYFVQREEVISAQMAVTNYDYALNSVQSPRSPLLGRDILICDEGHELDQVLTGYVSISPTYRQIEMLGGFPHTDSVDKWKLWAESKADEWAVEYKKLEQHIRYIAEQLNDSAELVKLNSVPADNKPIVQRYFQVKPIYELLLRITDNLTEDWIISWNNNLPSLKPVWVNDFAGDFFRHWRHILMMSATLPRRDLLGTLLGLDDKLIYEREVESVFPLENRRVLYKPLGYMSAKNWENDLGNVMKGINAIVSGKPNDKILIHTHNYEITKAVVDRINDSDRVITHLDSGNRGDIAKIFSTSEYPYVFVTPSFTSGLDVPDLKYNIIVKTMFPDLGDPWIRRRKDLMPDWYVWRTVADICQAIGRTPRLENVQGQTVIFDAMFGEVLYKNGERFFPDYIKNSIEW